MNQPQTAQRSAAVRPQAAQTLEAQARRKRFWVFLCQSANSVIRHQTLMMASSLAFGSLTAIVPMLLIGLAVATAFGTEAGRSYADLFLLSVQERLPDTPELQPLFDILHSVSARSREIAGIGLALLFVTAYTLLSSVEYAFNRIWQVTAQRNVLNRAVAYLATIILVPVLMSFSVYFSSRVETVARQFATTIEQDGIVSLFRFGGESKPQPQPAVLNRTDIASAIPPLAYTPPERTRIPLRLPDASDQSSTQALPSAHIVTFDFSQPFNYIAPQAQPSHPAITDTASPAPGSAQGLPLKVLLGTLSLALTCGALTLLLHFMPYTPVRWRAALYGGLFSGILIELTKYAFSYYAQSATTSLTRLYGTTMLAFPLALLWLWLIWVLILLGAEVAFNLQNYRDLSASAEIEKKGLHHRLYLAVRTVLLSCELFHTGENPAGLIERAAQRLGVPEFAIRSIVQQLAQKNVLRPVQGLEDAYLPGRDTQALTLQMIVEAMAGDAFSCPERLENGAHRLLSELFRRTDENLREQFEGLTMYRLLQLEGFLDLAQDSNAPRKE